MLVKSKVIEGGKLPVYSRSGDACLDCYARIAAGSISVPAHSRCLINLGFALELPANYEAIIRPRSGLSKMGFDIAIGTVDTNYRGELKACFINTTEGAYEVKNGDRICQLAIREFPDIEFAQVDELSETNRGAAGFGSSGK